MYNYFTSVKPVRKIESYRVCDTCNNQKETIIDFKKLSDSRDFSSTCIACLQTEKGTTIKKTSRQSPLSRAVNQQLHDSHTRMLNQALAQTPEITDFNELRNKYPDYDFTRLKKLQALNMKINAANDFLIEEQYLWLNPEERTPEGIEYRADLFDDNAEYETDKEELAIIDEQKEI